MPWPHRLSLLSALALTATGRLVAAATAEPPEVWSLHAQTTFIEQWHGPFAADYSGLNSLQPTREDRHTWTATGFIGRALWPGGELYYDPEVSAGTGLSQTLGVAAFPNGEATRASGNSPAYNTARLFLRQTFGFGGEREKVDTDQNAIAGERDVERLTVTIGKLSATDQFDDNRYSHDPRTQFLNWALMDNGAWDYPADSKGYTGGATLEWNEKTFAVRWAGLLEPREANGLALQHDVARALGQVLEAELRYSWRGRGGTLRPMVSANRAHMGSYAVALAATAPVPDVTQTRAYRWKTGAGFSWDQELTDNIGAFARAGWNDGRTESWAFTEIDRTVSAGLSLDGARWRRTGDTFAVAAIANGLSSEHRRYLEAGGYGFIVGDGRLNYAPEQVLESYYNFKPWTWLALALDWQWVSHPGYNRDRGPVSIWALRAHLAL